MTAGADWESWKLAHAYHRIGSGTTPTSGNADYYDDETGTPWITTSELRETYIERTSNRVTQSALQDFTTLRTYKPNSVFMAMYGATIGRLGISTIPATCNQACCVFESSAKFDNRFLFYWLWHRRAELISLSVGGGQPNLSQQDLKFEKALCPPLETQKRIAAFLDEKTAQIDALITRKQALLARLAEKRQAIITQAVTKGLNPAAALKDSGIDWLGQIPAHWEVRRIKEIGTLIGGAGFPHEYQGLTDLELPFFKVMDLGQVAQNEPLMETSNSIDRPTARALGASIISAGDIVFAKVGAALLLNRFRKIGRDCCIDNNMMAFRPSALIGSEFALQALSRIKFADIVNPGAVPSINGKQIGELCIALPPEGEQAPITAYILDRSSALEYAEARVAESLAKLAEYRAALITSAVTGQIAGLQ